MNTRPDSSARLRHHNRHRHNESDHLREQNEPDKTHKADEVTTKESQSDDEPNNNYLPATTSDESQKNQQSRQHQQGGDSGLGSPVSLASSAASASSSFHESYSDADLVSKNTSEHVKRNFQLFDIVDFVQNGMNVCASIYLTLVFILLE